MEIYLQVRIHNNNKRTLIPCSVTLMLIIFLVLTSGTGPPTLYTVPCASPTHLMRPNPSSPDLGRQRALSIAGAAKPHSTLDIVVHFVRMTLLSKPASCYSCYLVPVSQYSSKRTVPGRPVEGSPRGHPLSWPPGVGGPAILASQERRCRHCSHRKPVLTLGLESRCVQTGGGSGRRLCRLRLLADEAESYSSGPPGQAP